MNAAEVSKTSESRAMDIVSMAFSNVSENSDLMEVVSAVSQQTEDGQGSCDADAVVGHCAGERQSADGSNQNGEDHPDQIEIPLPPNAIITVNEQGEQIIELAQVVGEDPEQACLIENVNCVEQVEQVETEDINPEVPAEPAEEVAMAVGGDGLEAMAFHADSVGMVGNEACAPVSISLSDVQHLQQAVGGVSVGPSGDSLQVSSSGEVTSSTPQLPASESSLFRSLAINIMDTSASLTTSNASLPAAGMDGVTFVSAAGVPIQAVPNVRNSAEPQAIIGTGPSASAAQFIHNGTNLQQINFNESLLIPQKSQLINNTPTSVMGAGSVINSSQVQSVPQVHKTDMAGVNIGNRSVFSPMTLTIRTPPGAPAVNQALINSIVNNLEVQALLKRNPGQPITIVRVPEDPLERTNNVGVVTAKVVTTPVASTLHVQNRPSIGRPRKEPAAAVVNAQARPFPGRRRGRQPGTKLRKKVEEYTPPASWQPVKSRTRSGRISRPPGYRTENFRTLNYTEKPDNPPSDAEGSSDIEPEVGSRVSVTLSGRVKKFKCRSCSKAYIGRGGLARHFGAEPTHGSIDSYDPFEGASPKPEGSTSDEMLHKPDGSPESEVIDRDAAEGGPDTSKTEAKSAGEQSPSSVEEPAKELDKEADEDEEAEEAVPRDSWPEPVSTGRRGRPPGTRQSNSTKDDPDFRPGASTNKGNAKSKERRKETMKQALKFLNNEDYMDVCLPRVVRNLSLWDFLISKAEMDKEDASQVLKVLQLFEELLSDVREMAVNCLEKVDDEDMQTEGIYLDDDDDLARVLEFDKGWYNVSEPPPGAVSLPFGVTSLMKRTLEVVSRDDLSDEETVSTKRRKVEDDQLVKKMPLRLANAKMKPMATDPKSITVHVHDGKVMTEHGSPPATSLRAPLLENRLAANPNQEPVVASNSRNEQGVNLSKVDKATPVEASKPSAGPGTQLVPASQPANPPGPKQQSVHHPGPGRPAAEVAPGKEHPAPDEDPQSRPSSLLPSQSQTEASAMDPGQPDASEEDVTDGQQGTSWPGEDVAGPSHMGTQFAQAAEDLASLAASADASQNDKVEQSDAVPQEETSVVVPEGSTIMQMQDGTFLVQRPDGTAMQIHTPEGMTIETVQELLSMEAGQG